MEEPTEDFSLLGLSISSTVFTLSVLVVTIIGYFLYNQKQKQDKEKQDQILEKAFIKGYTQTSAPKSTTAPIKPTTALIKPATGTAAPATGTAARATVTAAPATTAPATSKSTATTTPTPKKTTSPPTTERPRSELAKTADMVKGVITDPNVAAAIGIQLGVQGAIKVARNKIVQKTIAKAAYKVAEQSLKITARVLQKMGARQGAALLSRLGLRSGQKAAEKAAQLLATKAAQAAAKAGAKAATKLAFAGSMGPAGAAMLAFDVLSMGLDIGDAGGYGKMGTLAEYIKMRDGINAELKKAFESEGGKYPSIVGPFDKLPSAEYSAKITVEVGNIMNTEKTPLDPLVAPMLNKLTEDMTKGILKEADIDNEKIMEKYMALIDMDKVLQKAQNNLCSSLGGKMVDRGNSDFQCSYKDRKQCESSYSWPLREDNDNETYAEYKDNLFGGACVGQSSGVRGICESVNIPYDTQTGLCKINEIYCKSKGADWAWNNDIKQNDCMINQGQNIAEMIFGTTIVRGFKQIFDPAQYEQCNGDETDDGYFCRKVGCKEGDEINGAMCYPKCRTGFHPVGCCVCSPDCPAGWTDDGATCRRAGYCDPNEDRDGALCYPKCRDGFSGAGPVCWKSCPDGYKDLGAFCSRGGEVITRKSRIADWESCGNGRDIGGTCWEDYDNYTGGCGTLILRCHDGSLGCKGNCYKTRLSRVSKNIGDRARTCNSNENNVAGVCWERCPEGYVEDGALCRRPIETIAKESYGRGGGTPDTKIQGKPDTSYGRGVGYGGVNVRAKKRIVPFSTKDN
jgi:hypothetical protein